MDLLVTDVGLPGGINGRQLADAALGASAGIERCCFVTGYAENSVVGHLRPGMHVLDQALYDRNPGQQVSKSILAQSLIAQH